MAPSPAIHSYVARVRQKTWVRRLQRSWPFVLLGLAGTVYAYFTVFSRWAPYDDEGYVLTSLQSFADGNALYTETFSQYGPFYYELFGALFAATGRTVTTDAGRLIAIGEWICTAGLLAASVHGLTRSRLLALGGMAVSLVLLVFLGNEPMHPTGLLVVLLALLLTLVTRPFGRAQAVTIGAVCAAVALTKVNVGAIAVVAFVVALTFAYSSSRLRWPAIALAVGFPLVLASADFDLEWVRRLVLMVVAGITATAVTTLRGEPGREEARSGVEPVRWLWSFAAGGVGAAFAIVVVIVGLGTSVSDLVEGVVVDPMHLREVFVLPSALPEAAVDWSLAAVLAAVAVAWVPAARTPRLAMGAVRVVAGLVVWFSISGSSPVTLSPASGPLAFACLLAWLAVRPAAVGDPEGGQARFARLVVVLLPVLGVMQAYPVAGSQVSAAALLFVPVGGLLLHDGGRELRATVGRRSDEHLRWLALLGTVGAIALVAKFAVPMLDRTQAAARAYHDLPSLALDGAHRVHIDATTTQGLQTLVAAIRENCDAFISRPGFNSLYVWTGMRPPTGQNAGDWMLLLDDETQQAVVDAVRSTDRLCLVQNDDELRNWLAPSTYEHAPDRPLTRYLDETRWEPVTDVLGGRFRLLRR